MQRHAYSLPTIKEISFIKAASGGTTKKLLSYKPFDCIVNLDSKLNVDDDGDD